MEEPDDNQGCVYQDAPRVGWVIIFTLIGIWIAVFIIVGVVILILGGS